VTPGYHAGRAASRQPVRELGFTGATFAGTNLSPSTVHSLLEIERGNTTARDLGDILRLEKSSVSRMLRRLVASGDVQEKAGDDDGRVKMLSLTMAGKVRVAAIHAFAQAQVSGALSRLQSGQDRTILEGLRLYADALAGQNDAMVAPRIEIVGGYQTGLIARITEMHALYYSRETGFGQRFESVVAGGLAEFCNRLESPRNAIWAAIHDGRVVGSIAIDGEDFGGDVAHLRWFIVDGPRGNGTGRKLLLAALGFVDGQDFTETHLWTFSGLSAARHLYETCGFTLTEERPGHQWGNEVLEQRFVRTRP